MTPELREKMLRSINTHEPYSQHNHLEICDVGPGTSRIELEIVPGFAPSFFGIFPHFPGSPSDIASVSPAHLRPAQSRRRGNGFLSLPAWVRWGGTPRP